MIKIQKRTLCALRQLLVLELRSALRANMPGKQSLVQDSTQLEHWLELKVKVKVQVRGFREERLQINSVQVQVLIRFNLPNRRSPPLSLASALHYATTEQNLKQGISHLLTPTILTTRHPKVRWPLGLLDLQKDSHSRNKLTFQVLVPT